MWTRARSVDIDPLINTSIDGLQKGGDQVFEGLLSSVNSQTSGRVPDRDRPYLLRGGRLTRPRLTSSIG